MKIIVPFASSNPRTLIRRCGYAEIRDSQNRGVSYTRRLTSDFYPRFHVYLQTEGAKLIINLHLDQKRPSYQGSSAHSGEYEGPTVEREAERIKRIIAPD